MLSIGRNPLLSLNTMVGIAIAFVAWVYVFKRAFETGWIRALGISVVVCRYICDCRDHRIFYIKSICTTHSIPIITTIATNYYTTNAISASIV